MRTERVLLVAILATTLLSVAADAQWLNYPTPGIPRLPDGKPNLSAPAPLTSDGKPDLSGLWRAECLALSSCWGQSRNFDLARGLPPGEVELTPWSAAVLGQRVTRKGVDDPAGYCLPHGHPRMAFPSIFKILQTPTVTAFLYETIPGSVFRQVFTDGRPLPEDPEPTRMGYSVGRWDGDTFVVETSGFRDRGWLDARGRPHSDALRVIDRYRRTDFGHMDWAITIDDPKAFVKAWTVTVQLTFAADTDLLEGFCDNHDKTMEHRRIDPAPPEPPSPRLP